MAASRKPPCRRRQWVVNRPLQFRFVKVMVLVLGGTAAGALGAVYVAVRLTLSSFDLARDPVIMSLLASICWTIVLELVIMTPIVVWLGIRLTHRVAGPLVRIRAALAKLAAGDYNVRIQLRKGDELVEFADMMNTLAASLRARRRP